MKCISFNINGLRAHFHQLVEIITKHNPDIIGLQETKISDNIFPIDKINNLGYNVLNYGYKNHYGVALLTKTKPNLIQLGNNDVNNCKQCRLIIAKIPNIKIGDIIIFNGYFPQGDNRHHPSKFLDKKNFYLYVLRYLERQLNPNQPILIIGDMNISSTDLDIGIGEQNRKRWLRIGKCSFLPEERIWINKLISWGMVDTWRHLNPNITNYFSWFDYRSKGFEKNIGLRVDLVLASHGLIHHCIDSGIDYNIRSMNRPSDHAPIWATFNL